MAGFQSRGGRREGLFVVVLAREWTKRGGGGQDILESSARRLTQTAAAGPASSFGLYCRRAVQPAGEVERAEAC
jgi:hypothetical protein